jgi:hypothetical protein
VEKDVRVLIDQLCALNMALGTLCALRSMLANMNVCRNTLDAIYKAEEVVAEKELETHEEVMRCLGLASSKPSLESTGIAGEVEENTE